MPYTATIPESWVRTRIDIKKGMQLDIFATGQMGVPNWGQFCGPEGLNQNSRSYSGMKMLSLVARIGDKGKPFILGSQYSDKSNFSGTLYLGIIRFRHRSTVIGSYDVKVEAH